MKKHFTAPLIFVATTMASQQVWALGFGRGVSDAVLGQAFTFTVPLSVDPGERFGLDCMSTQVYYGDAQLQSNAIRTDLERGAADNTWIVRITASVPVQEPIIEVSISAGCERRFTRRFSVFADPPTLGTSAAQLPQAATVAGAQSGGPTGSPSRASGPVFANAAAARHATGGAAGDRPRAVRKGPTMALANEPDAPAAAAPSARRAVDAGNARKPGPRVAPAPPADAARLLLDAGVPHLKLDMEEPIIPPSSAASGATIGLSELDDPDILRLRALEQGIQAATHERQAQQDQAARLKAELAAAQSRGDWLPWLSGLLAIAVAAIAALAWQLRQRNRIAHSDWFNQSQLGPLPTPAPPAAPVAAMAPVAPAAMPDLTDRVLAPAPVDDGFSEPPELDDGDARGLRVAADHSATLPLDRQAMAAALARDAAPRELSVEELLDLEQQADFFIALGQEDAAVDLLMSHLRSAGGQSPLPYTKLLEIYRRQGDRSAYERTRARFNRRFNAYAPDWDTGPAAGRSLEDYPGTIALLERAWPSPIDAMAILEGLLFKRDDTSELFDLPAYRDVLVLYSLARDLWQHGAGHGGTAVDVLLPLDDPGLDPRSVDVEGDSRAGMPTRSATTGFDPGHGGGRVDLELPQGGEVHATLDELGLAPAAPMRPKASPLDPPDSELPTGH
jgi:pilus assembly protein FimV